MFDPPEHEWVYQPARLASILCVTGCLVGLAVTWGGRWRRGGASAPDRSADPRRAVWFFVGLGSGTTAAVFLVYLLVAAAANRILNPEAIDELPLTTLWDLAALLLAILAWIASGKQPSQPAVLLILCSLIVAWTAMTISTTVGSYGPRADYLLRIQPPWWTWTLQLQFGFTCLIVAATFVQDARHRIRRAKAWPDHMEHLTAQYARWPAYSQTCAVIAAFVLVLGVYHLVRPGLWSWQAVLLGFVLALLAGLTCLFMAYRRWSANTGGLGLSLVTLSAVMASAAISSAIVPEMNRVQFEYAASLPILYTAVIYALAFMAAIWYWLSEFWHQQLLDDTPWTTTGRLIPYAKRVAFLVTALAALAAFQMAMWPRLSGSGYEDNSIHRIGAGLGALLCLAAVTGRAAVRRQSSASAALCITTLLACAVFLLVRMPPTTERGWLVQYQSVALSVVCLPILILAEVLPRTRWKCFAPPLWWLAVLIIPARAMSGLLLEERLPAEWVRPATLGLLGLLYVLAGCREGRRAFLVLGGVLFLAAALPPRHGP